jgi:hypothetical protein
VCGEVTTAACMRLRARALGDAGPVLRAAPGLRAAPLLRVAPVLRAGMWIWSERGVSARGRHRISAARRVKCNGLLA